MREVKFERDLGEKVRVIGLNPVGIINMIALDHSGITYLVDFGAGVTEWYAPSELEGV